MTLLRSSAVWFACALLVTTASFSVQARAEIEPAPVEVVRISSFDLNDPDRDRFGELVFVGGLVLRSSNSRFGALSGFRMQPGDDFYAISDTGYWFHGRLQRDEKGRPDALKDGRLAPILDKDGRRFPDKWSIDAESLSFTTQAAYISTEMDVRILRFPLGEHDLLTQRSERLQPDFSGYELQRKFGIEALATVSGQTAKSDSLLMLAEGTEDANGNLVVFLMKGDKTHQLAVRRRNGFYITDAEFAGPGELLILERSYTLARGPQARIRRIAIDGDLQDGVVLDGDVIFEAGRSQQIDNMEGISVFTGPHGKTRIGLVSDNNHWPLQRTLYLEFELMD